MKISAAASLAATATLLSGVAAEGNFQMSCTNIFVYPTNGCYLDATCNSIDVLDGVTPSGVTVLDLSRCMWPDVNGQLNWTPDRADSSATPGCINTCSNCEVNGATGVMNCYCNMGRVPVLTTIGLADNIYNHNGILGCFNTSGMQGGPPSP